MLRLSDFVFKPPPPADTPAPAMPSPNPIQQHASTEGRTPLVNSVLAKFLGTFRGWVVRKAVTLATVASAAVTSWLAAKWAMIESLASKAGVDADQLAELHAQGGQITAVAGAFIATLITGAAEASLSRVAAKVAEQPVIPKALPE